MNKLYAYLGCLLLCLVARPAFAQGEATWKAQITPGTVKPGGTAKVVLTANIKSPWHMYSLTQPAGGPIATTIKIAPGSPLLPAGNPSQPRYKTEHDKGFNMDIQIFEKTAAFSVPVKVKSGISGRQTAKFQVRYQLCNESTCLPPKKEEIAVTFTVGGARPVRHAANANHVPGSHRAEVSRSVLISGASDEKSDTNLNGTLVYVADPPANDSANAGGDETTQRIADAQKKGLLPFLAISAGFGFLSLLTPCVFPIVPVTVSFFAKRRVSSNAAAGVPGALAYCAGIITTFTGVGVLMAVIFGAGSIAKFAVNPYVNIVLAILFLVLAANLLGAFEIALPSGLVSKAQTGTQKGGLTGPFMMGLTFTLTSFTCTTAFVGTVLASAAKGGNIAYPILGMLAYSTAFALPFFFLALFPQYLARLPKSGSWLVSVKAFMGFVEIAAALKFLSNADLVWQKGWLTRPVFLAVWAAVAIIAGLYLLGWLRLPHDDLGQKIGLPRRVLGVVTAALGFYCFAAISGAPVSANLSAFLPPSPYPYANLSSVSQVETPDKPSVARGVTSAPLTEAKPVIYTKYEEALAKAKAENKPIFLDFTGVTCTNCRWMEDNIFPKPEVKAELDGYVRAQLYTDRDNPEDEANQKLQQKLTGALTLPAYVAVSPDGKPIKVFQGSTPDSAKFAAFLKAGKTLTVAQSF